MITSRASEMRSTLSFGGRPRLAVGDQRVNVLDAQAWISLIEPYWHSAGARREIDEFLEMHSTRRGWRVFREFEDEVEHRTDIFRKVSDVFLERAVMDREEADLIILQRHE